MNVRRALLYAVSFLLAVPTTGVAQSWLGIIPTGSGIDWSQAGIPGGIPTNRTQCGSAVQASTYGNGTVDATSGIQSALNACPANTYLLLGPGTFLLNSALIMQSNKTLRGSGPLQTILDIHATGTGAIIFGNSSPTPSTSNPITSGATQGSSSITVSGSGISVGQLLLINQNNVSTLIDTNGCTWCSSGFPGNSGQIVEVTGVSGTTITFRPPLYYDYSSNSPVAYRFNAGVVQAGLEYLQIYANNTMNTGSPSGLVYMTGAKYSWVKGVEQNFADGAHMQITYSMGVEIRDNFLHDGFSHSSGQNDDQLNLARFTSATLIENNIFYRMHTSIIMEWGAAGNVIGYNYIAGNYHYTTNWLIMDSNSHGAHPWFALFEGNIGDKFEPDDVWGSSSHLTVFRSYYAGSRQYVPPYNARGALQLGNAIWEDSSNSVRAFSIDAPSVYDNLVGSVAGSAHLATLNPKGIVIAPASGGGSNTCVSIGYQGGNAGAGSTTNVGSPSTTFLHGMYDCAAGAFQWTTGITHTLPASFYLASKPVYWGSRPWPGIGPDVTGGNMWSGYVNSNPAKDCFDTSAKDANGYPLIDPIACYSGSSGAPAPPTGLSAVVQ